MVCVWGWWWWWGSTRTRTLTQTTYPCPPFCCIQPATKLAATLTYHLAAVATGSALLAAVCDATGPHATRHVAAVAVVGALFCVQWGAFTCLLFKAASAV